MAEYLRVKNKNGFVDATRNIIGSYRQSEVLRYVVEVIMNKPEEENHIRDDNRGIMLLDLKTVIDCFDA